MSFFGKKQAKPQQPSLQDQLGQMEQAINLQNQRLEFLQAKAQRCLFEAKEAKKKGQNASMKNFVFTK